MKTDPRYQDGSGTLGVLAIITLIILSVSGGMWYEHGVMKHRIDKLLADRERDLRRWSEVAKEMDKVDNECCYKGKCGDCGAIEAGLTNGKE